MLDLNSDLGEGFGDWTMGDDEAMLEIVSSANIACGFHAGDPVIMRRLCDLAVARGVRIGAHVGHRDLFGFGRRALAIDAETLTAETLYQVGALDAIARASGDRVRYVKAHGALYHQTAADPDLAAALVAAVRGAGSQLSLLGPPNSILESVAVEAGIPYAAEGFADRSYAADGTLTPRSTPGAVLGEQAGVAQAVAIATTGSVRFNDGGPLNGGDEGDQIRIDVRSLCVHGDSPGAVAMARSIRAELEAHGVEVGAFT